MSDTTNPGQTATAIAEGPVFTEQTWDLEYHHALGETASRFMQGLAEGKILGRRSVDGRVLVPARSYDDRTHSKTGEWVEVGNTGTIEMSTFVYEPFKGLPAPPYAIAYATLDGADTALVGYVRGVDLADQAAAIKAIAIGTPIVVRFAEEPTGTAADYWFELAQPVSE
ncbi:MULTISPECIES: Zn-ribbon domain-containing OB-fold protein [unclassified Cryobacterium]|uniref:Zn-ribbon domain-containing OB-fold protein n=1 Tax=unclassified Cryobacterium TaxID=2649013 RepID=UPI00106AEDF6|nr:MULTISPECIES: OB-fold domain-containing protein [unclassified Cryobacterium]TFD02979.1 hypothetical protein E3T29_18600 [Cryobacterium sp. TMT1-66-1]TFD15336.1 hypothetical protein E3T35_00095 [Cryobacterium sp. TMT1-2-2]